MIDPLVRNQIVTLAYDVHTCEVGTEPDIETTKRFAALLADVCGYDIAHDLHCEIKSIWLTLLNLNRIHFDVGYMPPTTIIEMIVIADSLADVADKWRSVNAQMDLPF